MSEQAGVVMRAPGLTYATFVEGSKQRKGFDLFLSFFFVRQSGEPPSLPLFKNQNSFVPRWMGFVESFHRRDSLDVVR